MCEYSRCVYLILLLLLYSIWMQNVCVCVCILWYVCMCMRVDYVIKRLNSFQWRAKREKVIENYSKRLFWISHRIHCTVSNCQKRHINCASFAFDEVSLSLSVFLCFSFKSYLLFIVCQSDAHSNHTCSTHMHIFI